MLGTRRRRIGVGIGVLALAACVLGVWSWLSLRNSPYDTDTMLALDAQGRLFRYTTPIPALPGFRVVEQVSGGRTRSVQFVYNSSPPLKRSATGSN